jgi:hypothetical protein
MNSSHKIIKNTRNFHYRNVCWVFPALKAVTSFIHCCQILKILEPILLHLEHPTSIFYYSHMMQWLPDWIKLQCGIWCYPQDSTVSLLRAKNDKWKHVNAILLYLGGFWRVSWQRLKMDISRTRQKWCDTRFNARFWTSSLHKEAQFIPLQITLSECNFLEGQHSTHLIWTCWKNIKDWMC